MPKNIIFTDVKTNLFQINKKMNTLISAPTKILSEILEKTASAVAILNKQLKIIVKYKKIKQFMKNYINFIKNF